MDEATKATVESFRARFLNATDTYQRWKILNAALDWAATASENADHYRQKAQQRVTGRNVRIEISSDSDPKGVTEFKRRIEGFHSDGFAAPRCKAGRSPQSTDTDTPPPSKK
jgi:hypothetical protein